VARWQALQQSAGGSARRSGLAPWIVSGLAAVCFCAVVYWSQRIPKSSLCDGLLAPIFAAAIWAFSHSEWWPARVLSARWLVVLGEASFGLYLFHIPLLHLFEFLGWHHTAALFPVYLGLAIGISVLSFFYFETPMRRWILKSGRTVHVKETMEMASDAQ
jgi:peptidoglycan/LPS O-acetylase OafA/YrhL